MTATRNLSVLPRMWSNFTFGIQLKSSLILGTLLSPISNIPVLILSRLHSFDAFTCVPDLETLIFLVMTCSLPNQCLQQLDDEPPQNYREYGGKSLATPPAVFNLSFYKAFNVPLGLEISPSQGHGRRKETTLETPFHCLSEFVCTISSGTLSGSTWHLHRGELGSMFI